MKGGRGMRKALTRLAVSVPFLVLLFLCGGCGKAARRTRRPAEPVPEEKTEEPLEAEWQLPAFEEEPVVEPELPALEEEEVVEEVPAAETEPEENIDW